MKQLLPLFLLLVSGFSSAIAVANTFDPATNVLTMDAVTVTGDQKYSNVAIGVDQFAVLGVGSSAPIIPRGSPSVTGAANKNTFDPATNVLTMGAVTVTGDRKYSNVVIRIDQFTVLNAESPTPIKSGVSETCGLESFTVDNFNAIQVGMSLDQVTQIMGCKFDSRLTKWHSGTVTYAWFNLKVTQMFISVTFDESSLIVTDRFGSLFKFWQGRSFVDR